MDDVIEYVVTNIGEDEKSLLKQLNCCNNNNNNNGSNYLDQYDLRKVLGGTRWKTLKPNLELIGRKDIVDYIQNQTLVTKGIIMLKLKCVKIMCSAYNGSFFTSHCEMAYKFINIL